MSKYHSWNIPVFPSCFSSWMSYLWVWVEGGNVSDLLMHLSCTSRPACSRWHKYLHMVINCYGAFLTLLMVDQVTSRLQPAAQIIKILQYVMVRWLVFTRIYWYDRDCYSKIEMLFAWLPNSRLHCDSLIWVFPTFHTASLSFTDLFSLMGQVAELVTLEPDNFASHFFLWTPF